MPPPLRACKTDRPSSAPSSIHVPHRVLRHHSGAIEKAQTEQGDSENPDPVKLTKRIGADQTAEIAAMRNLLESPRLLQPMGKKMTLFHTRRRSVRRLIAASVLGAALLGLLLGCGSDAAKGTTGTATPASGGSVGLDGASLPPWPAPTTDVPARVASAGLDLGPMGTAEHYHPQLRVIIDGKAVPLPANIGVDPGTGAMSAVHTHETDGTIHIEADSTGEVFTLGQLFTQWGVKLTPTQIGGAKAEPGQNVTVSSNGTPVDGDPMDLRLAPEQNIVLRLP